MDCRYKIVHSASRGAPWKPWTSTSSEGRCSVSFLQISPLNFCRRYLSANTVVTCNGLTAVISKLKNFGNVTVLPTVTNLNCNGFSNGHKTFHCNGFTNSHKILISNFVIQIWNISLKSRNLKFCVTICVSHNYNFFIEIEISGKSEISYATIGHGSSIFSILLQFPTRATGTQ